VPVGEDQLAHIELSRQVVRRFNTYYREVLPEPRGQVTETPRLPGLDGRKMSKSYENAIYLSDTPDAVKAKVMPAPTDPARVKRTDPGNPEICNIFSYQKVVQEPAALAEIDSGCRTAGIGCVDCKKRLLVSLEQLTGPLRERRTQALASGEVKDVLADGNRAARAEAQKTMGAVREAIGL
jgi:tryptophanyl-tRNA synthetase